MLRRSGLLGLGLGSLDFKHGGMGTGRTAGAKSIVESGVIWQGHSLLWVNPESQKLGPLFFL